MKNKSKWDQASDALTELNRWKGARKNVQVLREIMIELREDERVYMDRDVMSEALKHKYQEAMKVAMDRDVMSEALKHKYQEAMTVASDYMTERGRLMGERTRALQDRDTMERLVIRALKYREPEE